MWIYLLAWYKQSHWRLFISVRLAPTSKPRMLQLLSLLHQLCPTHGICVPQTSLPWKEPTTSCGDFYSKMILIWCLPSGQSNTAKVISLLKEMFSEHGIPEILCSDNGPQYASAQFAEFCTSWGISHENLSPHYPQSNGFAEVCVKSVKHALRHAKYSGANLQLVLLVLWATPINTKLPSPAEFLYQCQLRTTIHAKIHNTDPAALQVHEQNDTTLAPTDHRLINTANLLHPCILVSQLPCTIPFESPLQWYVSYSRTATRSTPAVVLFTATQDDTCMNTVSSPLTLFKMPHEPHCRFLLDPMSPCCSQHLPSLHKQHSLCLLHPQCLWLQSHRPQLFPPCQLSQMSPLHLCLWHPA